MNRAINVIVVKDSVVYEVDSFGIEVDEFSDEVVELAENKFTEKSLSYGANKDDIGEYLENGYFLNPITNISVNLIWTYF
ncbi:MAG: hypothetical protein ACOC3Z_01465 [Nanoarchaeota archaeon]